MSAAAEIRPIDLGDVVENVHHYELDPREVSGVGVTRDGTAVLWLSVGPVREIGPFPTANYRRVGVTELDALADDDEVPDPATSCPHTRSACRRDACPVHDGAGQP